MDAIEKRARELLAAQIETRQPRVAKMLRVGWLLTDFVPAVQDAVAAIIAALTPPEGYVLVPVEPTTEMLVDGFESEPDEFFSTREEWLAYEAMSGCQQGHHRSRLCWGAMLAARPEVP